VSIESVPGEGTSATIYLPGHAMLPSVSVQVPPAEKKFDAPYVGRRGKSLVVEDQEEVRSQIVSTLAEMGCKAIEAGDGIAGLKIIESDEPLDLLISDVGLPGLGGLQLAEAARAARPDLPILLITGYAGKAAETLQLAPNTELLRKPFTLDQLADRVQAMLKGIYHAE
jgi:CheY-like chemotaxis protein